jgi:hypothetical protein
MSKLGNIVGKAAPIVGSVINSVLPGSGLIVSGLMSLFGVNSNSEEDLSSAIASDPLASEKLKEFQILHQFDLDKIIANDRDSARKRESSIVESTNKRDWVIDFLAIFVTLAFFFLCLIIKFTSVNADDKDLFYMLIGTFSSGWSVVLAYYFGAAKSKPHVMSTHDLTVSAPNQTHQ